MYSRDELSLEYMHILYSYNISWVYTPYIRQNEIKEDTLSDDFYQVYH